MLPYSGSTLRRCSSLKSLTEHRSEASGSGVLSRDGASLEYEALELRIHPPNIEIDQAGDDTLLTVDSANRPGTLVEVDSAHIWRSRAAARRRVATSPPSRAPRRRWCSA